MKISKRIFLSILLLTATLLFAVPTYAQQYNKDLFIGSGDVKVKPNILKGDKVKIYATVHNDSYYDLSGVVKFYDEKTASYIGSDQPVSVLAKSTDDVFIDWDASLVGEHPVSVRVVPWETTGDDPGNNKITKKIYVDIDTDGDGKGNRQDSDDDNDGVSDSSDAFPLDPKESKDSDKDGIGDNADTDDDGDGVSDTQDAFPLDPKESKDTDKDGVGDNSDPFPLDPKEWKDSDSDGLGDNADPDDNNKGPTPSISVSSTEVQTDKEITFNAINSKDTDGKIVKYEWDFDDGTTETGIIIEHAFAKTGLYLVTLKVTDDKGEYREKQIQINVTTNVLTTALIITSILLLLLLLGLLIPGHRFHYKRMFAKKKSNRRSNS